MFHKVWVIYVFTCCNIIWFVNLNFLVDGGWGEWTEWDQCSVSCGGADQGRTRECDSPAPQFGGDDCLYMYTDNSETQRCNENPCPSK